MDDSDISARGGDAHAIVDGAPGTDPVDLVTFATYRKADEAYRPTPWQRHPLTRTDALIAAAVVLAALLVRWPFIERGETLLHSDEAIVGLMAQDVASGTRFPIYFYGQRYMGALEAYVIAAVSGLFDDPVMALRFGPACFFALLVALQYLMLTRWFGRRGGLVGAAVLLAGAPMFAQWSISARGGYIEILLWGSALIWAYSEWFTEDRGPGARGRGSLHRFALGALIGSGLWINPSIALFLAPIVAHALLNRPLAALLASPRFGKMLTRAAGWTGLTTLPVAVILGFLALNMTWAVWVGDGKVHNPLLMDIFPRPIAAALLVILALGLVLLAARKTQILTTARALLQRNGVMVLGILAGATPAALYAVQTTLGLRTMDPSLPLGFRPIWMAGDTLNYLLNGLPLLFGADPRPFLQLVSVGRDTAVFPLDLMTSAVVSAGNWVVLGALTTSLLVLVIACRRELSRLLRLQPDNHPPVMLLLLGLAGSLTLYVMGGCTLDFTTIRYLVPLWVFVPGLLAAVFVSSRFSLAARLAPLCACAAWAVGQYAMVQQLGSPHPLRRLASLLTAKGIDPAIAEPLDAHLLSFLTQQRCRTAEFESFWPRLSHLRPAVEDDGPIDYVVQTNVVDRAADWIAGGWPGKPPPETTRFLWPRLRRALIVDPTLLLSREPLVDGYERIRLRRPLPERGSGVPQPHHPGSAR